MSSTSALCMLVPLPARRCYRARYHMPAWVWRDVRSVFCFFPHPSAPHLCWPEASTPPTRLLTPALDIWPSLVILIRWFNICAADCCDGLVHIAAAPSVVAHAATRCPSSFPLSSVQHQSCCCFDFAYVSRHKAVRLARGADWQTLGPLAWSIPFTALLNPLLFGQLLYPANAA